MNYLILTNFSVYLIWEMSITSINLSGSIEKKLFASRFASALINQILIHYKCKLW